jgi:hypothetical protein
MDEKIDDYLKKLKKNESRRKTIAKKLFEKADDAPKPKKKSKQSAVDAFFDDVGGAGSKADALLKRPGKDSDKPHLFVTGANVIQQADALKLPEDRKFKYLLVVVDTGTKLMDAVPIRGELNSKKVQDALKYIWSRPKLLKQEAFTAQKPPKGSIDAKTNIFKTGLKRILEQPVMLQTDGGPEFKKDVDTYLKSQLIVHRTGIPYRSRQQAYAEARNGSIAAMLLGRQAQDEVATGVKSTGWLDYTWRAIMANNKVHEQVPISGTDIPEDPQCKGQSCELLPVGTAVHRIEDAPRDVLTGKKQVGKFRKGDLRWETATRTITMQILKPGNPPLYRLSSLPTDKTKKLDMKIVAYTRAQVQVAIKKQPAVQTKTGQEIYKVEKIVAYDKKKKKYMVKWENYPSSANSLVSAKDLIGLKDEMKAARDAAR